MSLEPETRPRPPQTLHEVLSQLAADVRADVHGCVGDRPYRLWLVARRWTGGEPGRGEQVESFRTELRCGRACNGAPTPPRVVLSGSYSRQMHGLVEVGQVVVEELDPTYTEAELSLFGRLGDGDEAFVEMVQDGRDADAPDRPVRRLQLAGPPMRDPARFWWALRLREQEPSAPFGSPDGSAP